VHSRRSDQSCLTRNHTTACVCVYDKNKADVCLCDQPLSSTYTAVAILSICSMQFMCLQNTTTVSELHLQQWLHAWKLTPWNRLIKGEFKAKKIMASNKHLCLIKSAYAAWKWQFMLNKYDVWRFSSRILLAYYDCSKALIFLRMQLHILWWACLMLSINIDHYGAFSTWIWPRNGIYSQRTVFYLFHFMP